MKRTLVTTLTLALALPLFAEEAKKSAEKPKTEPAAATAPAPPADSPLVAAAKRSKRLGKKSSSKVITNETLKTSGANAHVTTTENQRPLATAKMAPPEPTPEMVAAKQADERRKNAEKQAAEKQKAEQERAQKTRRLSSDADGEEYPEGTTPEDRAQMSEDSNPENLPAIPEPPPPPPPM